MKKKEEEAGVQRCLHQIIELLKKGIFPTKEHTNGHLRIEMA
jgi:hypothetical protein